MTSDTPVQVLLVDDDPATIAALSAMKDPPLALRTARTVEEALELLAAQPATVVIGDIAKGLDLFRRVREVSPLTERILVAAAADMDAVEAASARRDIDRFVPKPFLPVQLRVTVRSAIAQHRSDAQNAELQRSLEERVRVRTGQLAKAKMEWERTFDAISDPLAILGRDRIVHRANLGYAQVGRRDIRSVAGMRCHEALFGRAEICAGCPLDAVNGSDATGVIRIGVSSYRVHAYPFGPDEAICAYRDVTADEAVTRRLIQSEKLTAAGQLAAGVAHEINNPLASILAFTQVMRVDPGRTQEDIEALRLMESSALRCKYIVETLLKFVREPRRDERGPVDVNQVCSEAVALMRPQVKGLDIELVLEHPKEQTWIEGSAGKLAQVLINLLQNAVHAVGTRGRIRVWCGPKDGEVAISVSDDGPGIAPDVRDRIFEPFFTTKPEGVGTGLGLSITHRIVEDHGGQIAVESEPGQGATFTVLLPPLGIGK